LSSFVLVLVIVPPPPQPKEIEDEGDLSAREQQCASPDAGWQQAWKLL